MRTLAHPPQHARMVHGVGRGEGGASLNALPSRWRLSLVGRWLKLGLGLGSGLGSGSGSGQGQGEG